MGRSGVRRATLDTGAGFLAACAAPMIPYRKGGVGLVHLLPRHPSTLRTRSSCDFEHLCSYVRGVDPESKRHTAGPSQLCNAWWVNTLTEQPSLTELLILEIRLHTHKTTPPPSTPPNPLLAAIVTSLTQITAHQPDTTGTLTGLLHSDHAGFLFVCL